MSTIRFVPINDRGLRIGEGHPRARLTDGDVEMIRALGEEGVRYRLIAEKFEITKWMVGRICRYERRDQTTFGFKEVVVVHAPVQAAGALLS